FLSVHINSATASAKGTETFYTSPKSQSYATTIHKKLVQATGFTDRGAKVRSLYVTRNTKMPAVLIEIGFISNPVEAREMAKEEFQQRIADAVYEGIKEYVAQN
ncbi:N-acetylmuramoyl-L-alanine amidase family protein, partial [Acinetobacter baumannii]|uniref:N-acetylmuramoyl-L-alanine amidase family protein n=1 Tax=Acinetobacter baumannii TaxID=470 RepID=UPI000AC53835